MMTETQPAIHTPIIYVIDDDDAVRQSVQALVESMNYRCRTFASGSGFLENYSDSEPGVVVVDFRIPDMDGLQIQEALSGTDSLPVIFITAYADVPVAVRAMAGGAVTLLEKPYDDRELQEAIRKAAELDVTRRARRIEQKKLLERLAQLSSQEEEVMRLIVSGQPNKVIAGRMGVSLRTIEERRRQVFLKTQTNSVAELVHFALRVEMEFESDSPDDQAGPTAPSPAES